MPGMYAVCANVVTNHLTIFSSCHSVERTRSVFISGRSELDRLNLLGYNRLNRDRLLITCSLIIDGRSVHRWSRFRANHLVRYV